MYYDRQGNKVSDAMEWAKSFQQDDRSVAKTTVGGADVSTVFLGLDHRRFNDGPPLIFETMIFRGEHDQKQWWYSTEAEATAGHERVVAALKNGTDPQEG